MTNSNRSANTTESVSWPLGFDHLSKLYVLATLLPFALKAGSYALLGSFLPLLTFVFFTVLLGHGLASGGRWARYTVRAWSVVMIVWGAIRLLLLLLLAFTDLNEAHLRDQQSVAFVVVSAAYVVAGLALFRRGGCYRATRAA